MKTTQQRQNSGKIKQFPIVIVQFKDGSEHFFGSLAAIYQVFTPEQIGVTLGTLWNHKITQECPYVGQRCTIRKAFLMRMAQK